ncbi:MAG: aminodeoxychorismate synthase component I [Fusobacterium sp.]|nr:aminodeoxychorismate synthase component I [Fusobacterium sp.]
MLIYSDKLFENLVEIISAFDRTSFFKALERIEELRAKYYIVGYIKYEAYKFFQKSDMVSGSPLLYFEVYKEFRTFTQTGQQDCKTVLYPQIAKEQYFEKIDYIKEQISLGNTYEVNYTIPNAVWTSCEGLELFNSLLASQKTPYNAYIKNDFEEVLSFSPELFFRVQNGCIFTKPMKGTVKRGETPQEDEENKKFLQNDEKNRAENVMIVDLLRNDLGRIAKTGTVRVDKLFEIETHKTLHQMTSEVSAELAYGTTICDIFEAIFPCGSITGAPKVSTMRVIDEVEECERGIYCGAIGLIHSDFVEFSVPIRILQKKAGAAHYICHTGGAIVWDSAAEEEWEEALLKSAFLKRPLGQVETMAVVAGKILFEKEHRERIGWLAKPESDNEILRITSLNGEYIVRHLPLKPVENVNIRIAETTTDSSNPYLRIKTDFRPWYKIKNDVFDEIYFNERGELTEGARSNVIIEKNGKFYTPPIKCGLLNGIYRQLLNSEEKVLYKEDLLNAEAIYCCNSVRGMVKVCLL